MNDYEKSFNLRFKRLAKKVRRDALFVLGEDGFFRATYKDENLSIDIPTFFRANINVFNPMWKRRAFKALIRLVSDFYIEHLQLLTTILDGATY